MASICKFCGGVVSTYLRTKCGLPYQYIPTHALHTRTPAVLKNQFSGMHFKAVMHKFSSQSFSYEETEKFSKLADKWWDHNGPMKALHSMNNVRVPFIRDNLLFEGHGTPHTAKPLDGVSILEVGCGVGVLSECLARLGASVVGLDPCEEALAAAKLHRGNDADLANLQYLDSWLEDIVAVGTLKFDCVVASEVIEHVTDCNEFIKMCSLVLKPNGSLFISTINRTWLSKLLAIIMAENVLGIVPRNTHDWNKFISPDEISKFINENQCHIRKMIGLDYNPLLDKWSWSEHKEVNYILHATKEHGHMTDDKK